MKKQGTFQDIIDYRYKQYITKVEKTAKRYIGNIPDEFSIMNKEQFSTVFTAKYNNRNVTGDSTDKIVKTMADKTLKQANILSYNEAKSLMSFAQKDKEVAEYLGIEEPNAKNIRNVNNIRDYEKYAENLYNKLKSYSDEQIDEWVEKHGLKDVSLFEGTYKISHIWGELFYGS